jgi:predicted site-specific integrase-resolvase
VCENGDCRPENTTLSETRSSRAALYLRVSTDKQTVQNQELQLRQVAERRGWEVVEVYDDAGISGARRLQPPHQIQTAGFR